MLRVDGDGPTSSVTALAFSPDGRRLYTAGLDKLVRVWDRNEATGRFELRPAATLRVPIGPGDEGFIYCIAVSPDGKWLAVGGRGAHRASPGFREGGFLTPREAVPDVVRADDGQIYLFNTATGEARTLRGHMGPVLTLAFSGGNNPSLYSVGRTEVYREEQDRWWASVRRFDVQSGKYQRGKLLPEPGGLRPGLAVLSEGGGLGDRPVLAWGDGNVRVWDVASHSLASQQGRGALNSTVVADDRRRRVITGSYVEQLQGSRLQLWETVRGRPYLQALPNPLDLGPRGNLIHHPQAVALLDRNGDGRSDLLAALLQNVQLPDVTIGWELRLYDYGNNGFGAARRRISLPDFGRSTTAPALAASSGDHLAVAAGNDDSVLVFSVADLLDGDRPQPQRLSSTAPSPESAAFARKNASQGLLIEDAQGNRFVYDFGAREAAGAEAWVPDSSSDGGWRVTVERGQGGGGVQIVATDPAGGRGPIRVPLPEGHRVTGNEGGPAAQVVVPPGGRPVLIVASEVSLSPTLAVYDLASRSLLRQYSGHTSTIRSVAGSADGRLLVTSGDDHTVRVWSLIDLPAGANVPGGLPGIDVEAGDPGGLVVSYVAPVGPAADRLRPGDRILAVRDARRRLVPSDKQELHRFLERHRAGDEVVFELDRGREVPIRLVPAPDERKPLFTMFFNRQRDAGLQWVGWSPLGPFDSSDEEIEQDLGWHFNAPGEAKPARFARLEQYPEFRRVGVLQELLRTATPPQMIRAPLSRPAMQLSLQGAREAGATAGEVLLRTPDVTARLAVVGMAPRDINRVELRVNGEPVGEMQRLVGRDWSLNLDDVEWDRRTYNVQAVLVTRESEPQSFTETVRLRYQPPAPRIELVAPQQSHAAEPRLQVVAAIAPSAEEPCRVELTHRHGGLELDASSRSWTVSSDQQIDHDITLREGLNEIELQAVNVNAMRGYEQHEQTRTRLVVHYAPAAPPEISVAVMDETDATPLPIGGRVEIDRPQPELRFQLVGGVAVPKGTLKVTEVRTKDERSVAVELPQEGSPVTQTLDIREPGQYSLSLEADAAQGPMEVFRGTLVLSAPLPAVRIVSPEDGARLFAGRDDPEIVVEAQLTRQGTVIPFEATVLRNGIPLELTPTIRGDSLSATVPIEPGENYLQVRLDNGFRTLATGPVLVRMLQLPSVDDIEGTVQEEPLCDLRIVGESAHPIQKLRINGQTYLSDTLEISRTDDRWQAEIAAFPLQQGPNSIEVVAYNRDGASEPHAVEVVYEAAPPEKAVIRVLRPNEATIRQPEVEVEFTVATESPLRRYEIWNNGTRIDQSSTAEKLSTDPEGRTVYRVQRRVTLSPQGNNLRIVVVNGGGAEKVELPTLSYIRPPARFQVTDVELVSKPGQRIEPSRADDGTYRFPEPASENLVYIHGNVTWMQEAERPTGVMALVNEFQWPAVTIEDTSPNKARFRIPALLNHETNRVILTSTDDKDDAETAAFVLPCSKPAERVRLHLLVVGVGIPEEDEEELRERARNSLGLNGPVAGRRREAGLDEFVEYPALVGSQLGAIDVIGELIKIGEQLQERGPRGNYLSAETGACDVVMVYYEGGQIVMTERGPGISTRPIDNKRQRQLEEHALPVVWLEHFVRGLHGAQVMLLELARNPDAVSDADFPRWDNKTRTAVFRYVWLKGRDGAVEGSTLLSALSELAPIIRLADLDSILQRFATSQGDVVDYQSDLPEDMASLTLGR